MKITKSLLSYQVQDPSGAYVGQIENMGKGWVFYPYSNTNPRFTPEELSDIVVFIESLKDLNNKES